MNEMPKSAVTKHDLKESDDMNENDYDEIGNICTPDDFKYTEIIKQGKNKHDKFDDFYKRHPFMPLSKRAKIFSPFDALKGFSEAAQEKTVQYQPKIILDEDMQDEISRRLDVLQRLTINSRAARENQITVCVTYFVPCSDKNHEAYGYRGQYTVLKGVCKKVDDIISKTILIDDAAIAFDDILSIDSTDELFLQLM